MGGAEGKPAKFGAGGGGVGTVGEPELCILGAKGKPIALTVGGAEGKPAKLGAGGGRGGVGTDGEPELRTSGEGGGEQIAPSSC